MYGYTVVEIMLDLDVFLVRDDVLQEVCGKDVADKLPSFEWLGEGVLGGNVHRTCDNVEARRRLVDFPLALQGKNEEASVKAMEYIQQLNSYRIKNGMGKFCDNMNSTGL